MYVYYLTRGFIASTRVFNLLTHTFILLTHAFNLPTRAFNLATRAFILLTRGFELATRGFELVTQDLNSQLVTRDLIFHKNMTSYTFLLVFKIAESLQCILKEKTCRKRLFLQQIRK